MVSPRVAPVSPLHRLSTFKDPSPPLSSSPPPAATATSPLEALASDPVFSAFLSPSFSSTLFSSQTLTSDSAASRAESLHSNIRLLDSHLLRHDDLLRHLSLLRNTESSLFSLRLSLSNLQYSLRRARSDLSDPRRALLLHSVQLLNLHSTADLLAASAKLLRLSKKLRDLLASDHRLDLAKAAEMHREIEILYEKNNLKGIAVVEEEIRWLSETGNMLRSEAMKAVERGMEESNQNGIWCGLQVFYNIGELRSTVDVLINKYVGCDSNILEGVAYTPSQPSFLHKLPEPSSTSFW